MRRGPGRPADRRPPASTRDRWLLSYADFLTLLLALFVVLYASARVDAEKNRGLFEGLQSAFALGASPDDAEQPHLAGGLRRDDESDPRHVPDPIGTLAPLKQLESSLLKQLDQERARLKSDPGISIHATERGLVLSLAASEYFREGGAEIPPDRKRILASLAPLLGAETGALHFEGHTDGQPVRPGPYPSNWELSSARAAAVARYFIEEHELDPTRVATTGYADQRPVVTGDGAAERARNRRVEIVVLEDADPGQPSRRPDPERELSRLLERLPPVPDQTDEAASAPQRSSPAPRPAAYDVPLP